MTERTARRTRRRREERPESGQALVLFALALVSMLAMAGLLVDGGRAWSDRRVAQNAADTSALAAAKSISAGETTLTATAKARDVAQVNGFTTNLVNCAGASESGKGVLVNYPPLTGIHASDPAYVEVAVTRRMSTTFAKVTGQSCWLVSARAVAKTLPTYPTGPALLALDHVDGCGNGSTMKLGGANVIVHGDVISNGGIDWTGAGGSVDGIVTYATPCLYKDHGHPPATAVPPPLYPNPFTFTTADFTCTNGPSLPSKLEIPPSGLVITEGTYCATDSITIKQAGATCSACTLIAPKVIISAADVFLRPREHNVLMWGQGTGDAINWSGAGGDWAGIVYSPNGDAHISGKDGATITGAIWAKTVELAGANWSITPPPSGAGSPGVVKLVE